MTSLTKKSFFDAFSGLACIYKNQNQSMYIVTNNFKLKLQQCAMAEQRRAPLRPLIRVHEKNVGSNKPVVSVEPDLTSHELVAGPPFEFDEFNCEAVDPLSRFSSGVQVIGVNERGVLAKQLTNALMMRVYHIDAFFGRATDDGTVAGKTLAKTAWENVKKHKLEKLLAALQAEHQKAMYTYSGVPNLTSPEAYRLACSGLVRPPHTDTPPIIYGIKCVSFKLPLFSLEIHTINENGRYLADLVHNIGARLKSSACCLKIRRVQQGPFTIDDALLDKHWNLEHVAKNITSCTERGREVIANLSRDTITRPETRAKTESEDEAVTKFLTAEKLYRIS